MNDRPSTLHGPVAVARHVDQVCDEFEAACKAGRFPRVEEYLDGQPEPQRRALLRELIPLEWDYRLRGGARPTLNEFLTRFPDEADLIEVIFREAGDAPLPSVHNPAFVAGHEILGVLGRGAMGVVYKARQVALNRLVALKMILADAQASPEQRARFLAEAQAAAALHHPNVVQIYEIGEHNGLPFLTMEFVCGGSLADKLVREGPLSARQASELVETLARTVHVAHQHGIVHRDLKPANVLLAKDGTPRITDFGLAKFVGEAAIHLTAPEQTQSGAIVGTPSYMAPEQASGRSKEIGPAADVYALGAMLYELLTGRPPFRGLTMLETLVQVRDLEPTPPREWHPNLPRDLETICLKCLRKEPPRRYASALALAEDLHRFIQYEPIEARRTPVWRRLLQKARRRPAWTATGAFLLAVLLVTLGLVRWSLVRAAAEQAQRALASQQRRTEFQLLAEQGRDALAQQDWENARLQWQRALDRVGQEAVEPDLEEEAERVRTDLEQLSQVRDRYRQFCQLRDTALFHETLHLALGAASSRETTETAARKALELFGSEESCKGSLLPPTYASEAERNETEEGTHHLLLVLAEVVACPRAGQDPAERAAQALRILDTAAGLARHSHADQVRWDNRAHHLRRARYLLQCRDLPAALREQNRAAELRPDSALDFFLMGQEYLHRGQDDLDQAAGAFEEALRRQPDHFWARYQLALCYLRLPRPRADLARAHLLGCLSQRPDFPWLRLLIGFTCSELGDFAAAAAEYQRVEEGHPDDEARYALLVNRGVLRLRQAEAISDSAGVLDVTAALAPNSCQPHAGLLRACRHCWLHEAVVDFQRAQALRPEECMALVNLARAYRKLLRPTEALAQLDQAVRLAPDQPALYRERARAQLGHHNLPAAQRDLEEALRRQPAGSSPRTRAADLLELGQILYQRNDYEKVVKVCDDALVMGPEAPAHRLRARALLKLERYPEAVRSLDRCVSQGDTTAEVYRARGLALARVGRHADAVADYTRALDQQPDPLLLASRGWLYLLVHESPRLALADFEESLGRDPANGDAYNGRGFARVLLGQTQPAVEDAHEAVRRGPRDSRLYYNAARIFAQAVAVEERRTGRGTNQAAGNSRAWQECGLELLRKALDRCPAPQRSAFWRDYVRGDVAFQSIRHTPGFSQLAGEYAPKGR